MAVKSGLGSKLKNPYILAIPLLGTTAASAYSVYQYGDVASVVENNYLARVQLSKPTLLVSKEEDEAPTQLTVHGKYYDLSDEKVVKDLLKEDKKRLLAYYRKHNPKDISISSDEDISNDDLNLYIHLRDKNPIDNVNNFWIEHTQLNQISIDRYGYEYDDKGIKKETSKEPKVVSILNWQDIDLEKMSLEEKPGTFPSISFRFFNKDIPKSEVEIIHNEDENKFKIEEDEKKNKGVSGDWYVWLDKSLLSIKLNYALQTYVFNQAGAHQETLIKSIVGEDALEKSQVKSNDQQKAKWSAIQSNYKHLPEGYEKFAKDYIKTFIDTSGSENNYKWSDVVNYVISPTSFIKTQDLNKIYNVFQEQKLGVDLFKPHIVTKITGGKTGNWKDSLNLEKEKDEKAQDKKKEDEEKESLAKEYEPRDIKALTDKEEEKERLKNLVKILPDLEAGNPFHLKELFTKLTKYSVKNFTLTEKENNFISPSYSESSSVNSSIQILSFQHQNEYGIYLHEKWIPAILVAIFLLGISSYLITAFKGPGAIMAATAAAATVNVAGVFFALGSQLSLIGVFAAFIGFFYTLFLSFYALGFLRKIFSLEFLDSSNVWVVFKRGLIMATDISLPLFIFSTFLVFIAPHHLQEFGIVLALFNMVSYLLVAISGCLMAIKRASSNFLKLGGYFFEVKHKEDVYLSVCNKISNSKKGWVGIGISLVTITIATIATLLLFGFNSFSFLKDNYLVIGRDNVTQLSNELNINSAKYISLSSQTTPVYLVHHLDDTLLSSLKSSSTISLTKAFSDYFTLRDLAMSLLFSYSLIFAYVFIRFKFKNLLILVLNTSFSILVFVFLLLVSRVFISSSIFLAICSFLAISLIYNLSIFSLESNKNLNWFIPIHKDINNGLNKQIKWSIVWFAISLIPTCLTSFWVTAAYISFSLITVHLLSSLFYSFLFNSLEYFKEKYLWKQATVPAFIPSESQATQHIIEEEESLDMYDEEIIEGINRNY